MSETFRALILRETEGGRTAVRLEQLLLDDLPVGDVLVAVDWSGLNYKDGLCIGPGAGLVSGVESRLTPEVTPRADCQAVLRAALVRKESRARAWL